MIKRIMVRDLELQIKTNILKDGACYFGDRTDLYEILRTVSNKIRFEQHPKTDEAFLVALDLELKKLGIKPYKLSVGSVIHDGSRMTDFSAKEKQTTIQE